jgi:hypothetical protein
MDIATLKDAKEHAQAETQMTVYKIILDMRGGEGSPRARADCSRHLTR